LHSEINADLNQKESENVDGMDMVICSINEEKKELTMAGAKNSLVYIQDEELHYIKGDIFPIGGTRHGNDLSFTNHTIKFNKPTTFYMFSDGYIDQFGGPEGRKFMSKRFKNILLSIHKMPMEEQKEFLNNTIKEWMGTDNKQLDDILVWGFKLG
jgi:serine phosphatase RsbU (regulator of sigma subunit)